MKANLQQHEIKVLHALKDGRIKGVEDIEKEARLEQVAVARACLNLKELNFVRINEKEKMVTSLTPEGKEVLKIGLPEKILLNEVKEKAKRINELTMKDKDIAIGWAKRKGLIDIDNNLIKINSKGLELLGRKSEEERALELVLNNRANELSKNEVEYLRKRKLVTIHQKRVRELQLTTEGLKAAKESKIVEEVSNLTPALIKTKKLDGVIFRKYNVLAPVKDAFMGKRHFVNQAAEYARKIWLEMGFKEMYGTMIQTAFWNFDALFTPQDHPAREMQATFYVKGEGELPESKLVKEVKKMHEIGDKDSVGWSYNWNEKIAKKLVLRTHTTVLSARTIAVLKKEDLPAKYFTIGKCFRNEVLDWKHLFEFDQSEGIVVDENANFKHLIGYLIQFYRKMGYEKVRIRPAYFPYTEMSVEPEVWHPARKEWIELGGAGIFRPEVVKPLLGKDVPVLAWGLGFGRTVSEYYKINDLREFYKNDVNVLRKMRMWMM